MTTEAEARVIAKGLTVYPTECQLLDDLVEFVAARLPALHQPDMSRKASLAEEWWLEAIGQQVCPIKQGWSFVYRFARDQAVLRGRLSDGSANLLAHQLCVLLPTLFTAARGYIEQLPPTYMVSGASSGSAVSHQQGAEK